MNKTIRTTWPQVRIHESGGHQYYLVDCRRAGLSIPRKTFKVQSEALNYAAELSAKFSAEGSNGLKKIDFVMSDQIAKWTEKLTPYGKTVDDAVEFYLTNLKNAARITKTASEYIDDWMNSKINNNLKPLRPTSVDSLKKMASFFKKHFNGSLLTTLDQKYLTQWFQSLEVNNSSKFTFKRYLNNFFRYLINEKLITENPVNKIEIQTDQISIEIYSVDEIKEMATKVLQFPEVVGFFALCTFAGIRPNEAIQLSWEHINLEHGEIFIPANISKTRRSRMIYCQKHDLNNVIEWLKYHKATGLPLIPEGFNPYHSKVMKAFKTSLTFDWLSDALRHTFASVHYVKHQSYETLTAIMGNSKSIVDKNYKKVVSAKGLEEFWTIVPIHS